MELLLLLFFTANIPVLLDLSMMTKDIFHSNAFIIDQKSTLSDKLCLSTVHTIYTLSSIMDNRGMGLMLVATSNYCLSVNLLHLAVFLLLKC